MSIAKEEIEASAANTNGKEHFSPLDRRMLGCCLLWPRSHTRLFLLFPGSLCWGAPAPAGGYEAFYFIYFSD